jgi:hypothetical protein
VKISTLQNASFVHTHLPSRDPINDPVHFSRIGSPTPQTPCPAKGAKIASKHQKSK